jgi:hypothetical protein
VCGKDRGDSFSHVVGLVSGAVRHRMPAARELQPDRSKQCAIVYNLPAPAARRIITQYQLLEMGAGS